MSIENKPFFLPDANEIHHSPGKWRRLTRNEAFLRRHYAPIAIISRANGGRHVSWFEFSNNYFFGNRPYDYSGLEYFEFLGKVRSWGSAKAGAVRKAAEQKDSADADVELVDEKKLIPSLFEPAWLASDTEKSAEGDDSPIKTAMLGESVLCSVKSENLTGDTILFAIHRSDNNEKIETLSVSTSNRNGVDVAIVRWQIHGKMIQQAVREAKGKCYFIAKQVTKKLECKSPILEIIDALVLHLQIDVDDERNKNDILILETTDGGWKHSVEVGQMKEYAPDWIELVFPDAPKDKSYTLTKDPKDGEDPFQIFENVPYSELAEG